MVILSVAAPSKTGKTTFLEHLIPILIREDLRVGYLKHCHHPLHNQPNGDSKRMAKTGAVPCIATTSNDFDTEIQAFQQCQIVLVEGFRSANLQTIIVKRDIPDPTWILPKNILCEISLDNLEQACILTKNLIYTKFIGR